MNLKGEASVNDISKQLDIKMPTVNSMMKRLAEKKLVDYESYKPLKLTDKGKKQAALIIRKHRLTEMYLVEKMGFGWEEVHHIAEQIEHIQAPEFFEKMDELLDFPKVDPHGSPIPDINGNIDIKEYFSLSEFKKGDKVTLKAVSNSSDDFLKFLNSKELSLDTVIDILSVESFDGTMSLTYNNKKEEVFSKLVCDKLLVIKNEGRDSC